MGCDWLLAVLKAMFPIIERPRESKTLGSVAGLTARSLPCKHALPTRLQRQCEASAGDEKNDVYASHWIRQGGAFPADESAQADEQHVFPLPPVSSK